MHDHLMIAGLLAALAVLVLAPLAFAAWAWHSLTHWRAGFTGPDEPPAAGRPSS